MHGSRQVGLLGACMHACVCEFMDTYMNKTRIRHTCSLSFSLFHTISPFLSSDSDVCHHVNEVYKLYSSFAQRPHGLEKRWYIERLEGSIARVYGIAEPQELPFTSDVEGERALQNWKNLESGQREADMSLRRIAPIDGGATETQAMGLNGTLFCSVTYHAPVGRSTIYHSLPLQLSACTSSYRLKVERRG